MSVLARDARVVLERHKLSPATIDGVATQLHLGVLLESDQAASAFFERLLRLDRFTRSGRLYFRGTTFSGTRVTCTILREFGSVASAVAMTSMLIDNKPDAVFIISRCAGLRPNQNIGDVVISTEILAFEPTFSSNEIHHIRPHVSVTAMVLQDLGHDLSNESRFGQVHIGPLASVSMGMKSVDLGGLEMVSQRLIALDVGAAGAVQAANAISSELPVVVVSVIADILGNYKYDRPDVSYRATEVVLEMISRLKVVTRGKRRSLTIDSNWR